MVERDRSTITVCSAATFSRARHSRRPHWRGRLAQAEPPADGDKVPAANPHIASRGPFGKYKITRLVAGANTIYGYSHFNYVYSAHMADYHSTGGCSRSSANWSARA